MGFGFALLKMMQQRRTLALAVKVAALPKTQGLEELVRSKVKV